MIIKVTNKHIKRGKPVEPDHCPIALAFKDKGYNFSIDRWQGKCYAYTGLSSKIGKRFDGQILLPKSCFIFTGNFDDKDTRKLVKPFSFKVTLSKRT